MDAALKALGQASICASPAALRAGSELLNVVAQCSASDDNLRDRVLAAVSAGAASGDERTRCTALQVVSLMLDSLGARLAPHHAAMAELLPAALASHVHETRQAAAAVAGSLAHSWCLTAEAKTALQTRVLPALLACAYHIIDHHSKKEVAAWHAADGAVLHALTDLASLMPGAEVTRLAGIALQRASSSEHVHHAVRLSCLSLVTALVEAQPACVSPDAPAAASALLPLCEPHVVHHHRGADDDDDDDDAQQLAGAARDCLTALAVNLPERSGLHHPVLRALSDAFEARSPHGAAALRALAAICEPCRGALRPVVPQLVLTAARGLGRDQSRRVRAASADAALALVTAMPVECGPCCGPLLIAAAAAAGSDSCAQQRMRASVLLAATARELSTDELEPHLDMCVTAVLPGLVASTPAGFTAAANAISCLAAASGDSFAPYAGASLGGLAPWFTACLTSGADIQCVAAAIAAGGAVIAAAPPEVRAAAWPSLHAAAAAGFATGQSPLREAALRACSAVAKAEDEAFAPHLASCVPVALTCATDALAAAGSKTSGGEGVHTGAVEEAMAAAEALGAFAASTGWAFMPFVSDTLACLDALLSHPVGCVRAAACRALSPALAPLRAVSTAPGSGEMASAGANVACGVLNRLAAVMVNDPDGEVVAEACAAAGDVAYSALITVPHSAAPQPSQVELTVRATLEALDIVAAGAAACQADAAADDGDEDVDDAAACLADAAGETKAVILAAAAKGLHRVGEAAPAS